LYVGASQALRLRAEVSAIDATPPSPPPTYRKWLPMQKPGLYGMKDVLGL
jgi:hypothetical protein